MPAEQLDQPPEHGDFYLRQLLERARAASTVASTGLVGEETDLAQSGVEQSNNSEESDVDLFKAADDRVAISRTKYLMLVDHQEFGLTEEPHRLLAFLCHPDRIGRSQGLRAIYNHVHKRDPGTPVGHDERRSVSNIVYHLRTKIGIPEVIDPKWGFIRHTGMGFKVVLTLRDKPPAE